MYSQIDSNKRKTTLLMVVFFILVIALGWFIGVYMGYGYGIFLFAVLYSMTSSVVSYFGGAKVALMSTGAREIQKEDNPYVYRMIENLCISQGMPTPKVHIIDSPALNAFATGRNPEHAHIAVTSGLIAALENEELEGVLAHELSHIKNYDILVMTVAVVLVGTIALVADLIGRMFFFGGGSSEDRKIHPALLVIGLLAIIISPIVAEMMKLAISRRREYLADASGALMTRYPEGLARALEKISASNTPLPHASAATSHLFISNPFKGKMFGGLFSSHPPAEERIKRLRETIV